MIRRFRLMTVNLLHERGGVVAFEGLLDRHRPDVVVAQELAPGSAEVLAARYPSHMLLPATDYTGRGIATRFASRFGEIGMPRRPGMFAVLDLDGREVRLANIHLVNPISFPWWASVRARTHQLEAVFGWIDGGRGSVVAAGDLNASPVWPAYKRLAARLTDVVAAHADRRGVDPDRTWAWRPGWPRMLRIDHVFATPDIKATEVIVDQLQGSDHWALVADLEVGMGDGAP